jgi:hypothetical protein
VGSGASAAGGAAALPGAASAAGEMSAPGGANAAADSPPREIDPRVADALQRLRSGVRQRQAETATVGGWAIGGADAGAAGGGGLGAGGTGGGGGGGAFGAGPGAAALARGLVAVRSQEYVQEPVAFSHRARLGKLVVTSRKAFFHLFLKWFMRPVLAQQNAFNQSAAHLLQELAEAHERTSREARLLAARVAALEAAAESAAAAGAGAMATASESATEAAAESAMAPAVPQLPPREAGEPGGGDPPRR